MGNAYLYYYPEPRAAITRIDLGSKLRDMRPERVAQGEIEEGDGGHVWPVPRGAYDFLEVQKTGITSQTTWRALLTMQGFFVRGALVGVSNDHAKSFCGEITGTTVRGTTSLVVGANLFSGYSASAALASGDMVVIESGWPESLYHVATLAGTLAATGGTVTINEPLPADFREGPVTLRFYDFYPLVSRRGAGPIVTHRVNRLIYDLTFACRQATRAQSVAVGHRTPFRGDTADDGKPTTWDILGWQFEGGDNPGKPTPYGTGGFLGGGGTGGKG